MGYIGDQFYNGGTNMYAFVKRGVDYSTKGIGQVTFIEPTFGSVTIDGHTYQTTRIGNREWICGSLRETFDFTYAFDGTQSPQYTYYSKSADNARFGCMYNGYAALRINSHLTDGWRVPTINDLNTLLNNAGGISANGKVLIAYDITWAPSWNGSDFSKFGLLPGGVFEGNYSFRGAGTGAWLWSSTENNSSAYYVIIDTTAIAVFNNGGKGGGTSLRLVKDVT